MGSSPRARLRGPQLAFDSRAGAATHVTALAGAPASLAALARVFMLPDSLLAFVATLEQAGDTAPVAVRAIRAAQSELAALVHAWLLPALPAGMIDVGGAADAPTTPIAEPS